MKQVNLLVMPNINKENIFREYEIIFDQIKKQKGGKKAGKFLARSFFVEVRRIISGLPKAQLRSFSEKVSEFLNILQEEGLIDLRKFTQEEGLDLMRLLYDVQGFYEDKIQADTPRLPMEFMFPYHMFPQGSKVVIYGAGNVGRLIYRQAIQNGYVKIMGIVDKNYRGMSAPDLPVKPVSALTKLEYDYILISIRESSVAYSVRKDLGKLGIPAEKIKWDGKAVFRDEFYRNLYFPMLKKLKNVRGPHDIFLKKMSKARACAAPKDLGYNSGYYESIKPLIDAMPESNGSRYYKPLEKTIGWITDPFAHDAYLGSAPYVLLTPDEWEEQIEQIDLLLIATGWRGFNEEWRGFAIPGSEKQELICRIVKVCNERGIPTVFYSKEDPVSYERYIKIAQACKYVFTSAIEKVADYLQVCQHDRVSCLKFGLNPRIHNPIGIRKYPKRSEVVFAGSWYDKYPERCADTERLFDGVLQSGRFLRIISRNSDITNGKYRFPDKYISFMAPAIDHKELAKVHKLHDWSITLNSVKDSQTMFAARAYELMASGNLLLSNYSMGINSLLPEAFLCQDINEIPDILNCLTAEEVYEHQIAGVRFAYKGNTCYERLHQIMSVLDEGTEEVIRRVAVVVSPEDEAARQMFEHQTYPHKVLVTEDELKRDYEKYDMATFFRSGSYYGDFYLEDMINAFKYTASDYITKDAYYAGEKYIYGMEHDYVSVMPDKYRTVFWTEVFKAEDLLAMQGGVSLPNGYSIDHFMYNEQIVPLKKQEEKPLLSVIVPVYNNGTHLYGKCFSSLRRSSIFHKMEIILVDDGSTDNYTPAVIRTLAHAYPNVRTYFYEEGGSGSASRPRNKGVEMATADYITFLDPDNEAVNDAYAKMLSVAQEEDRELVLGEIDRFDTVEKRWKLGYALKLIYNSDEVAGGKDFIEKLSFRAMSIQAMVIKKSFLASAGIRQVEGAIGQDTLFAWQLFYYAQQIRYVPVVAHIYYAGRDNSVLNDVTVRFFEKYLVLEKDRVAWLRETGLLKSYNEIRFPYYFNGLYLKKFESVAEENKQQCIDILRKIVGMYEVDGEINDEVIRNFMQLGVTEFKADRRLVGK